MISMMLIASTVMAELNVIVKQNSMVLEDHAHSKCIHDEIDERYTRNVQGFQFNSYDGYDCYNIDEYAIYQNHMLLLLMLKSLLVHAAISMVPTKNCAFGEYGFWRGSGLNEYIYDDLSVGDYTNGECQSETKESGGDDCTADETVDCVD